MPVLESYFNDLEYRSRQDQGYYNSGLAGMGISIGVELSASYLKKRAKKNFIGALGELPLSPSSERSAAGLRATLKYKERLGFAKSVARTSRMYTWLGAMHLGYSLGKGVFSLGRSFLTSNTEAQMARYNGRNPEETFFDSRMAATQRARALQVIHNSRMSASPALGNEASYMHY